MMRTLGVASLLAFAALAPAQPAAAQDPLGGAIIGGTIGGIIGGAVGHGAPGGIIAGAVIGAATGAAIASEGQQRNGYFWWQNGCYYRYANGGWAQVYPTYCGY